MPKRISLSDLEEKMLNINVPEEELQKYLTILPKETKPFSPALAPNPEAVVLRAPHEEVDMAVPSLIDWILDLAQKRRLLKFEDSRLNRPELPILFAEGDSWFQFPVFLKELIDQLSKNHTIYCISRAGDTIQNMVYDNPDYLEALDQLINERKLNLSGFLFSGAGIDVIGNGSGDSPVLEKILLPYTPGMSAEWHVNTAACDEILDFVARGYHKIFTEVETRFPNLRIYIHGYDYVRVRGLQPGGDPNKPLWGSDWTSGPLRAKGFTDNGFGSEVIAALIDRLNTITKTVCKKYGERGVYVNLRGSVGETNWIDELHATSEGFARAAERFRSYLI